MQDVSWQPPEEMHDATFLGLLPGSRAKKSGIVPVRVHTCHGKVFLRNWSNLWGPKITAIFGPRCSQHLAFFLPWPGQRDEASLRATAHTLRREMGIYVGQFETD